MYLSLSLCVCVCVCVCVHACVCFLNRPRSPADRGELIINVQYMSQNSMNWIIGTLSRLFFFSTTAIMAVSEGGGLPGQG